MRAQAASNTRALLVGLAICVATVLAACASESRRPVPAPAPLPTPSTSAPPVDLGAITDAIQKAEARSAKGNPAFYTVLGKRYFVLKSAEDYAERGVASWYGPGFHAQST